MNPSFCNYWFFSFSQVLLFDIQIRTLKNHQLLDSPIEPEIRRQIWRERRRTLLVLSRWFSTCRRTQCASSLPEWPFSGVLVWTAVISEAVLETNTASPNEQWRKYCWYFICSFAARRIREYFFSICAFINVLMFLFFFLTLGFKNFPPEDDEAELKWIDFHPVLTVVCWLTEKTRMEIFSSHSAGC